jgi:hypothetical protein
MSRPFLAVFLALFALASCGPERAVARGSNKVKSLRPIARGGSWEETVAASRAMEAEIASVLEEYGFRHNDDLEEGPVEGAQFECVVTRDPLSGQGLARLVSRLARVSRHYSEQRLQEGTVLQLDLPLAMNPDADTDILEGVRLTSGPGVCELRLLKTRVLPEDTFEFLEARRLSFVEPGPWRRLVRRNVRTLVYHLGKQVRAELTAAVRAELEAKGYVESAQDAPWTTFCKGSVAVSVCNAPEVAETDDGRIVPQESGLGESRHEWPMVIVRVSSPLPPVHGQRSDR